MSDELIARMKARVEQVQKVLRLAHDPRMIAALQEIIDSGEADIRRLQAERDEPRPTNDVPRPEQH